MSNKKPKIVAVLGPTASGKSELGVDLAIKFGGEIVSADSRQVYRGLDIGSNKITPPEMKGIPHHLIDVVSPRTNFSVVQYQKLANQKIKQIIKKGKTPFLVGGSPLYLYAVTEGWAFPSPSQNTNLRKELANKNTEELFQILKKLDSDYARKVDSFNPRRLIRAIEIAQALGRVPPLKSEPSFRVLFLGLSLPREQLKEKIIQRLKKRMNVGLIEEVENLRQIPLSWKKLEGFGLEYRWVAFYLQGKINQNEMQEGIIRDSLKLVKHQMNWFKKDQRINWLESFKEAQKEVQNFLKTN